MGLRGRTRHRHQGESCFTTSNDSQTAAKWRSKFNRQLIPKADEGQSSDG